MTKLISTIILFLLANYVSAATVTYTSLWHYYDGPAYPQNRVETQSFLVFSGLNVQSELSAHEQDFETVSLSFLYGGQELVLDVDESQAVIRDPFMGYDSLILTGSETESIPGEESTWLFRTHFYPGAAGYPDESDVYLADINDASRYIRGYPTNGTHLTWSVVPVPASVWLFGSGLIGLIGFARKSQSINENSSC